MNTYFTTGINKVTMMNINYTSQQHNLWVATLIASPAPMYFNIRGTEDSKGCTGIV